MPVMGGVLLCLFLVLVSPLFLLRGQHGMTAISRLGQMAKLPDGVVTFLFTDVEGSTRLWEEAPNLMKEALRLHDGVIGAAVEAHNGVSVKPRGEGDSQFVVFRSARDAVEGSAEVQRQLAAADWPTPRPLRVRVSLHTRMADLQLGDYYGSAVNRAARLRAIAHGGQTVMSGSTWELVQDQLPAGVTVTDMGRHRLKDLIRTCLPDQRRGPRRHLSTPGLARRCPQQPASTADRFHRTPVRARRDRASPR